MTFIERYSGIRTALLASETTQEALDGYFQQILQAYDAFATLLPDTQIWKKRKPEHARHCAQDFQEFAPFLGFTSLEVAFFIIIGAGHDLGRMVQAYEQLSPSMKPRLSMEFRERWKHVLQVSRPQPYPDVMHGKDSARFVRHISGAFSETTIGQWMLMALECHSLKENPTLEQVGGTEEVLAMCNLIRDLDKVEVFRSAKAYTGDADYKAKQRLQNFPTQIVGDPEWGTELYVIDPPQMIDQFVAEQAIARVECRSYEAYMLQYLAWVFKITDPDMLKIALHEGGPQIVAAYLLEHLDGVPLQKLWIQRKLESWHEGALLRAAPAT